MARFGVLLLLIALHLPLCPHNRRLVFPLLSGHSLHPPPPTGLTRIPAVLFLKSSGPGRHTEPLKPGTV